MKMQIEETDRGRKEQNEEKGEIEATERGRNRLK